MANEEKEEFAFDIDDMAKRLKVTPASARKRCRDYKVKRAGRGYGWKNKTAFDADFKKMQGSATRKAPVKKAA